MTSRNAGSIDTLVAAVHGQSPGTAVGTLRAGAVSSSSDHYPWVKDSRGVGVVRAADIMTRNGDTLARNLAAKLNKHPAMGHGAYVIWSQHIISADRLGEGWRSMPDRGSETANHMDHVHVSVALAQGAYDYRGSWGALFVGTAVGAAPTPAGPAPAGSGATNTSGTGFTSTRPVVATGGDGAGTGSNANPFSGVHTSGSASGTLSEGFTERLVEDGKLLALTGMVMFLGVGLIALGTYRTTKPVRDEVADTTLQLLPQTKVAAAATTMKGAS